MKTYYRHTRNETAEVPYSFRCEHCGKDSGPLLAVIKGSDAIEETNYKALNDKQEEKLCRRAHENLVRDMKIIHQDAVEKQIFSTYFSDQCPQCQQPQSWALGGMKKKMFENASVCVGVGIVAGVIALVGHYFTDLEYMTLSMAIGAFGLGVAAAVLCLVWNTIKIVIKGKKTSSGMQNLPVIDWNAVKGLLNE